MPNYVTTILRSTPEVIAALLNEEEQIDFRRIIPEPDNIEQGGCTGEHPEDVVCWYDWRWEHWGTKWNAARPKVSKTEVSFDTAWSSPFPVIYALAKRFPEAEIYVKYADENIGYNIGEYRVRDGYVRPAGLPDEGSDEALDFASQILYGCRYADSERGQAALG